MQTHQFNIQGAAGNPIAIDLITSNNQSKPLVIFVHGFKGFKNWGTHHLVGQYFAQNGFDFLKFNFSHNGVGMPSGDVFDDLESFADNTFSKELFDINQVITFALSGEQFQKPTETFLIGHSLGGGISILQASEDKAISKLATWASISSFRNLWSPEQEKLWVEQGYLNFLNSRTNQQMPIKSSLLADLNEHAERLEILTAARNLSQPWLIVHGESDTSVPAAHATELHNQQAQSQLVFIPNADHVFGGSHPWDSNELPAALLQVCDATISFFKE